MKAREDGAPTKAGLLSDSLVITRVPSTQPLTWEGDERFRNISSKSWFKHSWSLCMSNLVNWQHILKITATIAGYCTDRVCLIRNLAHPVSSWRQRCTLWLMKCCFSLCKSQGRLVCWEDGANSGADVFSHCGFSGRTDT